MKSPFPGMDPYAEAFWPSLRTQLIALSATALNSQLPPELVASPEERVEVQAEDSPDTQSFYPDVQVVQLAEATAPEATTATLDAPIRLTAQVQPRTERFIRVVEVGTQRVITVIEFLSPANKAGQGMQDYKSKRASLLEAGISVVEIDLVRAGSWQALLRPFIAPTQTHAPYRALIRRSSDPGAVLYYPISLRQSMPVIPVPLRADDAPVKLELQSLFLDARASLRLDRRIDYTKPPEPPLEGPDASYVAELLKQPSP